MNVIRGLLENLSDGSAVLVLPIHPYLLQQGGMVHGGVLSYLLDNAIAFAAGSRLGPSVLSAGHTVEYLQPAKGAKLVARGQVEMVEGWGCTAFADGPEGYLPV